MINLTQGEFNSDNWNGMVIEAANNSRDSLNHKYIYAESSILIIPAV